MHSNPYGMFVEGVDVLRSLEETPRRIASLVRGWPRHVDERPLAPGKWTARQILAHLAHLEMVFATRLRFTLASETYVVQPFDQDPWVAAEPATPALTSLEAYVSLRQMNVTLLRPLTPSQRGRCASHPEMGEISIDWMMAWCAGHELNHVPQFERIAAVS